MDQTSVFRLAGGDTLQAMTVAIEASELTVDGDPRGGQKEATLLIPASGKTPSVSAAWAGRLVLSHCLMNPFLFAT